MSLDNTLNELIYGHNKPRYVGQFGLELELEGNGPWPAAKGWEQHAEGSLRGGTEYVLTRPKNRSDIPEAMASLNEAFRQTETHTRDSFRASTHIHVNGLKMSLSTILQALVLFVLVEPVFLRMCGPQRDGNLFCLPTYDSGDFPRALEHLCQAFQGMRGMPERGKYTSQNIDSLSRFGSVEYRCFPSTTNVKDLMTWTGWLEALYTHASRINLFDLRDIVNKAYYNPEPIVRVVFDDLDAVQARMGPTQMRDLIGLGCSYAHEALLVVENNLRGRGEPVEHVEVVGLQDWPPVAAAWDVAPHIIQFHDGGANERLAQLARRPNRPRPVVPPPAVDLADDGEF